MNAAAEAVMKELPDLVLAYGNSDEYRYARSWLLGKQLFETDCCSSQLAQRPWDGPYMGRGICFGRLLS